MKGLLKYLSPFAPDQSGAVAALYGLGGLIVICDAGGCTGNICGFDEPRWFGERSAVFSAGLRDMDAILGRDDRLIEKLKDAADHMDASFAALIGTPVPAVIATDFKALKRMAEKKVGLPILTVECTGTRLYDAGASDAYVELFRTFCEGEKEIDIKQDGSEEAVAEINCAERRYGNDNNILGVLGCTPLDISRIDTTGFIDGWAAGRGYSEAWCYGMGAGPEQVRRAGAVSKNLVLSPSGLAAAKYLHERFGTPYELAYPFFTDDFKERLTRLSGKRVLIVHQQVAAEEIRQTICRAHADINMIKQAECAEDSCGLNEQGTIVCDKANAGNDIVCGTWFMQIPELTQEQDIRFEQEDSFISCVIDGGFDAVIADERFKRALKDFAGEFINCPHFAVSGTLEKQICGK